MPAQRQPQHEVCLVIADLSGGGAQRVMTQLANAWAERGQRLCVVTLSHPDSDFFRLDPRVSRVCIGGIGASSGAAAALWANLQRLRRLRRAIKASGAPCVVSFVGTMNILTILASAGLGVRLVISERNDPARQSLGRGWDVLRRLLYPRADLVTANSRAALQSLAAFVPHRKLAFAPNPVAAPPADQPQPPRQQVILNVGRLTAQKAQDVLLASFAALPDAARDWRLVIVGTGEAGPALQQQAEALGIADRVRLAGQVADPLPCYRRAAIFVLPSRFEGTPNALLEAMANGLPPIVSDASGGPLEYVQDGETGLVVPADDPAALATAMARLIGDDGLRARLGAAAQARIAANGHDDAIAVWEELLGRTSPAPAAEP